MIADIDMNGIDNARNALLYTARQAKAVDAGRGIDWLLMIDSDTWVQTGSELIRMIIDAEDKQAAIVGAPVMMRGIQSPVNVFRYVEQRRIEGESKVVRVEPIPVGKLASDSRSGELYEVDGIGAAVMAVCLNRIKDATFRFVNRDGVSISEDLEFCRQVKTVGGSIYADLRVSTHHVNKPDILTYFGG